MLVALWCWFLYLLIRSLLSLPLVEFYCNRYVADIVKDFKEFKELEKADCKYCKLQHELDFSQSCKENNMISFFLEFMLANKNSQNLGFAAPVKNDYSKKKSVSRNMSYIIMNALDQGRTLVIRVS